MHHAPASGPLTYRLLLVGTFALADAAFLDPGLRAQAVTTVAVGGTVRMTDGSPADEARVMVRNGASGFVVEVTVRRGRFLVQGLETGGPYTITTGTDDNGDSIFNDRPPLTPRNSARLPWRSTVSASVSYTIPIGDTPGEGGRGGAGRGGPRGRGRQKGVTINFNVNNLTNRANYSGFSGVMTSPYFMQATNVSNPRQVDISLRFSF